MAAELAIAKGRSRLYGDASDAPDAQPTYGSAKRLDLIFPVFAQSEINEPNEFEVRSTGVAPGSDKNRDRQGRGLPVERMDRVLETIDNGLAGSLHIQDLAAIAVLSTRHFSTAFKRGLGVSPHRYVLERRIERARQLLAVSKHSIADITYQVGFSSQAHFTTMFRKLVGMTPGAFRARVRGARDNAADS